jgi:hypothetical protein
MKVWVATYQHRHGEDTRVFASEGDALQWREEIADEWWDTEMPKSRVKPEDSEALADEYWDYMEERDEFFKYEEIEVEGASHDI